MFSELESVRQRLAQRQDELLALQIAIAGIAAPTGAEGQRARFIAERLQPTLPNVTIDEAGNVVGTLEGRATGSAPVVVCAHLDTVFAAGTDVRVQTHGSRAQGPGIGDNARGLAALVVLAQELRRLPAPGRPVIFAATTGEEGNGDLRGARHLFATLGDDVAAVIALDGPGDTRIVTVALGARRLRARLCGRGGHSWAAFGVLNPIHVAAAMTVELATLKLPTDPRVTLSVNRVGGGSAINAIPEEAWFELELRSAHRGELERWERAVEARLRHALERANAGRAAGTSPLDVHTERIGERPSGHIAPQHPLVVLAREATVAIGRIPELTVASTDANIPLSRGIPAIAIGAGGSGGDTHTLREWYDHEDSARGLWRALAIVAGAANA